METFWDFSHKFDFSKIDKEVLISIVLLILELEFKYLSLEFYLFTCFIFLIFLVFCKMKYKGMNTLFLYFVFVSFKLVLRFMEQMDIPPLFVFPSIPTTFFSSMYIELKYNERVQRIYFMAVLICVLFDMIFSFSLVSHLNFYYIVAFARLKNSLLSVTGLISSIVFYEHYIIIQIFMAFILFLRTNKEQKQQDFIEETQTLPIVSSQEKSLKKGEISDSLTTKERRNESPETTTKKIKRKKEHKTKTPKASSSFSIQSSGSKRINFG